MSRYLVVANQTVPYPHLVDELQRICQRDPEARFVLVVPETPVRHLSLRRDIGERAESVAREHAEEGCARLAEAGIDLLHARVAAADPVEAVEHELGGESPYAGVVISTLPGESSRWLRAKLPQTIRSRIDLPVVHVEAPLSWVGP